MSLDELRGRIRRRLADLLAALFSYRCVTASSEETLLSGFAQDFSPFRPEPIEAVPGFGFDCRRSNVDQLFCRSR